MKRFWPWMLPMAVYAGLVVATALMVPAWITTGHLVVAAGLLVLYAAATAAFGPWRMLGLAAVPALWTADFALFMHTAAYDCYPSCTASQDILGSGLAIAAGLYLLVLGLAIPGIARRWASRRRAHQYRDGSAAT